MILLYHAGAKASRPADNGTSRLRSQREEAFCPECEALDTCWSTAEYCARQRGFGGYHRTGSQPAPSHVLGQRGISLERVMHFEPSY